MASSKDNPTGKISGGGGASTDGEQQRQPIQVDISSSTTAYANFCRVGGTAEELFIDFGLNTDQPGTQPVKVPISQRVVLNFYTAKRLAMALQYALQRHESMFGVLEIDVQKRVKSQPPQAAKS